jgi:DNA-binding response OmpR family regulator
VMSAQAEEPAARSSAPSVSVLSPDGDEILTVALGTEPLRVGRECHNDIVLPDPDKLVSREHCVLERVAQHWWVRDLDSRNHVFIERAGHRARVGHAELLHGDAVCVKASADSTDAPRHWRLVFSDPAQTQFAQAACWLQYYPESRTVWVLGGMQLPRRVDAPPKARRMLLFMLNRYRELEEPSDGIVVSLAELKTVLWPEDADAQQRSDSSVASVAWELRPALGDPDQRLLQTVRDEGYRLVPRPTL